MRALLGLVSYSKGTFVIFVENLHKIPKAVKCADKYEKKSLQRWLLQASNEPIRSSDHACVKRLNRLSCLSNHLPACLYTLCTLHPSHMIRVFPGNQYASSTRMAEKAQHFQY